MQCCEINSSASNRVRLWPGNCRVSQAHVNKPGIVVVMYLR